MISRRSAVALIWVGIMPLVSSITRSSGADLPPEVGRSAPAFLLKDVNEKKRTLAEFRGRPVTLFFFCGCSWCADVAREWAPLQRSGSLVSSSGSARHKPPVTLVIYQGGSEEVRTLAAASGLDPAQTVLLPDPEMKITLQAYRADPCPRVFVVDTQGIVRYSNTAKDEQPRKAPALVIVSRTVDALRMAYGGDTKGRKKSREKITPTSRRKLGPLAPSPRSSGSATSRRQDQRQTKD